MPFRGTYMGVAGDPGRRAVPGRAQTGLPQHGRSAVDPVAHRRHVVERGELGGMRREEPDAPALEERADRRPVEVVGPAVEDDQIGSAHV